MATTYIADDVLLNQIARRLGTTPQQLVSESVHWVDIAAQANQDAYHEVRSRLVNRGYAGATIDQWDRAAEFNRRVALCFALREGAVLKGYDLEAVDHVCGCLADLDTVALLIGGAAADLAGGSASVSFGAMANTTDVFLPPDAPPCGCYEGP